MQNYEKNLKLEIERAIAKGYTTFLCGMALGFDMICAETVLAFNNYLCTDCNHVEFCDVEEQKSLMGDAFAEIDKQDLSDALTHVMSKIKEQVKFKA